MQRGLVITELHPLDERIIEILQEQGRIPVRTLAESLKLSETGTRYRLNKLLQSKTIVVSAQIEPAFVGRPLNVFIRIDFEGDPSAGAQELSSKRWVDFVALEEANSTGKNARLLAHGTFAASEELLRARRDLWALAGTTRVDLGIGLALHSVRPRFWGTPKRNDEDVVWVRHPQLNQLAENLEQRKLEDVDLTILRELSRNGRLSFTKLSSYTGLSTAATRQRYLKLVDDGVLRVRAVPNPYRLGFEGYGEVAIKVGGQSEALIERLLALHGTQYVVEVAGPYDVLLVQVYRSHREFLEVIKRHISAAPEVSGYEVSFYDQGILHYSPPVYHSGRAFSKSAWEGGR